MNSAHPALQLPLAMLPGERLDRLPAAALQALAGRALLEAISTVREALMVTLTPSIATAELARRVGAAAARGVDVAVLLPAGAALSMLWHARVEEWLLEGVKVFQSSHQTHETCVCVADDGWTSVVFTSRPEAKAPRGSVNTADTPTELLIRDKGVARSMGAFFRAQCADAREVQTGAGTAPLGWLRRAHHLSKKS